MARRKGQAGKRPRLDQMRVRLIPVVSEKKSAEARKANIQHLISLMMLDLSKRGRPRKHDPEETPHAA
jgi:hypothetical protein